MANPKHVEELNKGVPHWNQWRKRNPKITLDLRSAYLKYAYLNGADLKYAYLNGADLRGANLRGADLKYAYLSGADLSGADLSGANLSGTDLRNTYLKNTNLSSANLSRVNLSSAELSDAILNNAILNNVILNNANLSDADLSHAILTDIIGLETANLSNANFSQASGIQIEKIQKQKISNSIISQIKSIFEKNQNNANGLNLLCEAIEMLINESQLNLTVNKNRYRELIEIAYVVSLKKEESRYPKFQLYVPDKEYQDKLNFMISFKEQKNKNYEKNNNEFVIDINLNKLATLASIGLGIPQSCCAIVVVEKNLENESIIAIQGIIKLENEDEIFGELLNSQTNLFGLLLNIEAPGRLNIVYNFKNNIKVQLALVEGKIRISYDPTQTPLANIVFVQIAKNLLKKNLIEQKVIINNFQLIKIIQRVWHRILKLAVDFGHGSQFVIIKNTASDKFSKNLSHYFNIDQLTTQKPNLGECVINFFKRFLVYKSLEGNKDNIPKELLTEYYQLINAIDSIAYLSTIDGSIILDDSLSLIGFGGEIKNKKDLKGKCFELAADFGLDDPLFQESDDLSNILNKNKSELIKLFVKSSLDENPQAWNFEEFGTRHRSAARLCTDAELDPFVFVVSQTGDIREFMNLEGKVRILGPLRPL